MPLELLQSQTTAVIIDKKVTLKDLKQDLEKKFTMQKLRALETQAATQIQTNFRAYRKRTEGKPRSRAC